MPIQNTGEVRSRFLNYINENPHLKDNLFRQLLIALHTRQIVTIDQIYAEANGTEKRATSQFDHNVAKGSRWDKEEKDRIHNVTLEYAENNLTKDDIETIVTLTQRKDAFKALEAILSMPNVTFKMLADKVEEFCELIGDKTQLPQAEAIGIRAALIRHFISDQLELIGIAKYNFKIRDMLPIIRNSYGPKQGIGKIGGKAAGMFLAYNILNNALQENDNKKLTWNLKIPETYFLRSDLYQEFVHSNGLSGFYDEKYRPMYQVRQDYPMIREMFKNAEFPSHIVRKLTKIAKRIGNHPLIVRSSSHLEDNFGSTFSGKYDSIFLANQGKLEDRVGALLHAIASVYASTLGPDPILYRRERNLIDYDERMGIMIQKVVGTKYRNYSLPTMSGVAFSRNEYRWNKKIRKEDGIVRLVMGLGTRAVDRVGSDYPRMIPLSAPTLRPESSVLSIQKYSQRFIDVIDLENNSFSNKKLTELLDEGTVFPDLDQIVSIRQEDMLMPPIGKLVSESPNNLVITFDKLLTDTSFADNMNWILQTLEDKYQSPIDLEFAITGNDFYVLQCRPIKKMAQMKPVKIPKNIPEKFLIFSAEKDAPTGIVQNIEYIIFVDPLDYNRIDKAENKSMLGKLISQLNDQLCDRTFILMGPGRWGSNDINLGIPVRYSDIHNTKVLIEIARAKEDYIPEVSFGTHFFQDLVESEIHYLPLYPDEPKVIFNEDFLHNSENLLSEFLPDYPEFTQFLRVIHIPSSAKGKCLHLHMDGEKDRAISFLGDRVDVPISTM